ncbi:MAG: hypothetical protein M3177_05815 [Pseudomonadota bacterium]|nr:hypothetical protein [Pseudomonadota bacterium]
MIRLIVAAGFAVATFVLATWQFGSSLAESDYRLAIRSVDACYIRKGLDPIRSEIPPAIVQECTEGWHAYESGHLRRVFISMAIGVTSALLVLAVFVQAARLVSPPTRNDRRTL